MKSKLDVPVRNVNGDKYVGLELDTETGRVKVTLPTTFKVPQLNIDDLERAVHELKSVADAARRQ